MADSKQIASLMSEIADVLDENKEFLTDLDREIGDGDHGINMARGFDEVKAKEEVLAGKDVGSLLKTVGMTLVSKVGGSAGPLYGTAFMKAGAAVGNTAEIGIADLVKALEAGIEGVKARGKSTTGEKTMLDSMVPALQAMQQALAENASADAVLSAGVEAAKEGVEATKPMIATKGRASYLGERSAGHQDPGATSFALILETIAKSAA